MNKRRPAEVFHPGEHLKHELDARGWTVEEFAKKARVGQHFMRELIKGNYGITPLMAGKISDVLGTGTQLWLNLDEAYKEWVADE